MRVKVTASLDSAGLQARVIAHGPYADDSEVPKDDDGKPTSDPGEVSEHVDLADLGDEGAALGKQLATVLDQVRKLAADKLARRFQDAKFLTRQVALQRKEITR